MIVTDIDARGHRYCTLAAYSGLSDAMVDTTTPSARYGILIGRELGLLPMMREPTLSEIVAAHASVFAGLSDSARATDKQMLDSTY